MYMNKSQSRKSAKLTIEISLMLSMAIILIIAVLNMFGNSLRSMTASSGFQKFINRENANVVAFDKKGYDKSDINVAITGSQGLEKMMTQAVDALVQYRKRLQAGETLSQAELEDLARKALYLYVGNDCTDTKLTEQKASDGQEYSINLNGDFKNKGSEQNLISVLERKSNAIVRVGDKTLSAKFNRNDNNQSRANVIKASW